MANYGNARTSIVRRDLGVNDSEYDELEINDVIEGQSSWENFYELSNFNE